MGRGLDNVQHGSDKNSWPVPCCGERFRTTYNLHVFVHRVATYNLHVFAHRVTTYNLHVFVHRVTTYTLHVFFPHPDLRVKLGAGSASQPASVTADRLMPKCCQDGGHAGCPSRLHYLPCTSHQPLAELFSTAIIRYGDTTVGRKVARCFFTTLIIPLGSSSRRFAAICPLFTILPSLHRDVRGTTGKLG